MQIYVFCLKAETQQLVLRVEHRAAGFSEHEHLFRLEQELERCVVLSQQLDQQHEAMFVGEVIHTDGQRVQAIANGVLERLRHLAQLSRTSLDDCPERVQRLTFASKYVSWIVSDLKTATTRRVPREEPTANKTSKTTKELRPSTQPLFLYPSIDQSRSITLLRELLTQLCVCRAESFVLAYDSNDTRAPFAMLWVRSVVTLRLTVALTDELARAENLADAAALRAELLDYYPDLSDDDQVIVIRFTVVHWFRSGTSRICEQHSPIVTIQSYNDSPPRSATDQEDSTEPTTTTEPEPTTTIEPPPMSDHS